MASADESKRQDRPDSVPETFGRALAEAREARQLSVAEMAARLCQTTTRLRLMEAGQWEQLGPPVYGRGYVAAYARELGLDPGETASYFEFGEQQRIEQEQEIAASRPRRSRRRDYHLPFAYVAATALVAIPLAFWIMHAFQSGGSAIPGRDQGTTPAASAQAPGQPLLASMASLPEIEREPPTSAPELVLRFADEVWIDARDRDGARLAYGLMAAGTEQRLSTAHGLSVRLGDVEGVSAELDGTPFDLNAFSREDVVEFDLPADTTQ